MDFNKINRLSIATAFRRCFLLAAVVFLLVPGTSRSQISVNWKNCFKASLNSANRAVCARLDVQHNLIMLLYTWLPDSSGDIMVIKLSPQGSLIWQRFYDGPGHTDDVPTDMTVDRYNNIWICGTSVTKNGDKDILLLKFSDEGVPSAGTFFGLPDGLPDGALSVNADRTGCPVVAGYLTSASTVKEFAILRYDIDGNLVWNRTVSTKFDDVANHLVTDDSCNIYATGKISASESCSNLIVVKYDSSGTERWRHLYDGNRSLCDEGTCIAIDDSSSLYVTGYTNRTPGHSELPVLKFSRGGQLLMEASYNCDADDCIAQQLLTFKNSALIVAGFRNPVTADTGSIHYQFAMNGGRIVFEKKYAPGTFYPRIIQDKGVRVLVGAQPIQDAAIMQPAFYVIDKDQGTRFRWVDERVLGMANLRSVLVDDKRIYIIGDDAAESSGTVCAYSYSVDINSLDAILKKGNATGSAK
jgi:hypothetical protein